MNQFVVKALIALNHAISSEMLPRMPQREIGLVQAQFTIALQGFQRLRQAIGIVVAEENCSALPELPE
ncbi:MAG TPA: hypothetical protein VLA83_14890 [Candidatus Binatia bacterium]|nr:hypothetical protein [Candidatus Binatia bacterium]